MERKEHYKIFVINPGSTSTKVTLHDNEECILSTDVFHDSSKLLEFPTINDQLSYRMEVLFDFIAQNHIDLSDLDAIVGRGGSSYSVESGTYEISDQLIQDTKEAKGGLYHASMLGVQMAKEMQKKYGGRIFMVDPTVVDEFQDIARITGVKGVYRKAICHALNLKSVAKKYAEEVGRPYESLNLICCHIDGGISITAHHHGRMIDGNDAGGGEGPFTPTRMGTMAVTDVLHNLKHRSDEEVRDLCSQAGGFSSHFGTSNSNVIHKMVEESDPKATLIWEAMKYQIAKWIGEMSTVLKGEVDAIVLTGGLLRFPDIEETLQERCGWIAPIRSYPGEFEHETMALRALKVLRGEEELKQYTGKPVFDPKSLFGE